jgi:hypothetical protein
LLIKQSVDERKLLSQFQSKQLRKSQFTASAFVGGQSTANPREEAAWALQIFKQISISGPDIVYYRACGKQP